jgi:hypothetical protein
MYREKNNEFETMKLTSDRCSSFDETEKNDRFDRVSTKKKRTV